MARVLLIPVILLLPLLTLAQKKNADIAAVINELFAGYRAGDSSRIAAVFTNDAMLRSLYIKTDGEVEVTETKPVRVLIDYIGGGLAEEHNEIIWDTQIHADELMATVWTRYAFYLGNKFTHCGTETFLLRKEDNKWQIFYIVDTRQSSGCKPPAKAKK